MEKVDGTLGNLFTNISLINSNVDDIRQVANNQTNSMEEPYLLLTYRRDTSEVLIDLSSPIYVNGKHWGGVRCGYML
ncbi:MAG: hypothetical protein WA981_04435 [Glaciecola sp.]